MVICENCGEDVSGEVGAHKCSGMFSKPLKSSSNKALLSIETFNSIRKLSNEIKRYDSDTILDSLLELYQNGYMEGVKSK